MKYGNCVVWAFLQKIKHGGFIRVERLKPYAFVPRAYYSKDGQTWYRFAPVKPVTKPNALQKYFPYHVIVFRGKILKV